MMIRVWPGVHSREDTWTVSQLSRHSVRISGGTMRPVHTGALYSTEQPPRHSPWQLACPLSSQRPWQLPVQPAEQRP
jgi:hypothetical protein